MPVVLSPSAPASWDWHLSAAGADFYFGCQPDNSGVYAQIARPDGWDSPELRTDEQDIPLDDGADIGRVYFGKRILVLEGTIIAPDAATLEVYRRKLLGALRSFTTDGLFEGVDDDGIQRFCRVRRSGKPVLTRIDPGVYQLSAQLVAGDPRKYSSHSAVVVVNPNSTSGSGGAYPWARPFTFSGVLSTTTTQLRNNGDLSTPLDISLVGPLTSPLLVETTGTGLRIQVGADIEPNKVLVIDSQLRTAKIDNTSMLGAFSAGSTPLQDLSVPAQTTTAWRLIAGGGGHALLTAFDAWE